MKLIYYDLPTFATLARVSVIRPVSSGTYNGPSAQRELYGLLRGL
jgi:hypothetical protein